MFTGKHTDRQKSYRQTETHTDRQAIIQTDRQSYRQTDNHTDRQKIIHTDRQ